MSGASGQRGIGDAAAVPPDVRAQIVGPMTDAFASTYWWAFALVVVVLVIATPLLPKDKPLPFEDPDAAAAGAGAPPTVLVH